MGMWGGPPKQGFSAGGGLVSEGPVGKVWRHLWLSQLGWGCWWVEARDAAKHPTMTSPNKEGSDPKYQMT